MSRGISCSPSAPSPPSPLPAWMWELGLGAALTQCRQGGNIYGQEIPSKLNSFNENLQNIERLVV